MGKKSFVKFPNKFLLYTQFLFIYNVCIKFLSIEFVECGMCDVDANECQHRDRSIFVPVWPKIERITEINMIDRRNSIIHLNHTSSHRTTPNRISPEKTLL